MRSSISAKEALGVSISTIYNVIIHKFDKFIGFC